MPMKRCLDIVGALLLILVFAPITAVVALIVKLSSPGPVLFRQPRLGEQGELFTCLKFRTMVADAEGMLDRHPELRERFESEFKIKDDPRVTPIGKILRKTSLDELPQLINVLKGDMSLVGPRPIVPPEIEKYGRYGDKFLAVRPGLTGVWQVCGRSDTTYDERITMDMFYIDCHSVIMDLQLLASTVLSVLRCRGAY
jgi:lipopolysaccharide/colanic/teichoic acid biosynthesis glycosyltransferase